MSESDHKQPTATAADNRYAEMAPAVGPPAQEHSGLRLSRRGWTILLSMLVVVVFGLIGTMVRVPFVALGPGPTYDTLGKPKSDPVIKIEGRKTYPTSGQLRLTTVSVNDEISLLQGLGLWVSGRYALAPREIYFPPGETDKQVKEENVKQFQASQSNAEVAALRYLSSSGIDWAKDIKFTVLAKEINTGSPADKVLDPGDQLIVVNGKRIGSPEDVRDALKGTRPKDKITVVFRGEGKHSTKDNQKGAITLGRADDGRKEGFMGLLAGDTAEVDKLKIDIALADVGGPSAGLMFALAIVDRLTPGKLTDGHRIAGTGVITDQGDVESIGGISFKLASAREDGATVFLVPRDNCPEAAKTAPDGLRLVKVGTLDDAVSALEQLADGKNPPAC